MSCGRARCTAIGTRTGRATWAWSPNSGRAPEKDRTKGRRKTQRSSRSMQSLKVECDRSESGR